MFTAAKPFLARRVVAAAVSVAAIIGSLAITTEAKATTVRDTIVSIATRELNDADHNREYGGNDDCTYYGGVEMHWRACGPSGWGGGVANTYAWCAAFTRYVWRQAGVGDLSGIDGFARSFRTHGQNRGAYFVRGAGTPQPGDAIMFNWNAGGDNIDHVGIVTSVSGGKVYTIEGNAGSPGKIRSESYGLNNSHIVGYTSPSGAGNSVPSEASTDVAGVNAATGDVGVVRTGEGILAHFELGGDGWIYGTSQTSVGGPYSAPITIGDRGGFVGKPAVKVAGNETIAVYARGDDSKIYGVGQLSEGGSYGQWAVMGSNQPTFSSDPSVVMTASGIIALFATGTDGYVWGASQSGPGQAFGEWTHVGTAGAGVASQPQAVVTPSGLIAVFARNTAGTISAVSQTSPGGSYGGWSEVGSGTSPIFKTAPSIVITQSGILAAFATDKNGYVQGVSQAYAGGPYGGWSRVGTAGAGVASRPQVIVARSGVIAVYARTVDGSMAGVSQISKGGQYGTWSAVGANQPTFTGDPSGEVAASGAIVLFSNSADGTAEGLSQTGPGGSFGSWS